MWDINSPRHFAILVNSENFVMGYKAYTLSSRGYWHYQEEIIAASKSSNIICVLPHGVGQWAHTTVQIQLYNW